MLRPFTGDFLRGEILLGGGGEMRGFLAHGPGFGRGSGRLRSGLLERFALSASRLLRVSRLPLGFSSLFDDFDEFPSPDSVLSVLTLAEPKLVASVFPTASMTS